MRSLIEVIEQLHDEFGPARARVAILAVADRCRDQIDATPVDLKPELLQRLVRQQLLGPPAMSAPTTDGRTGARRPSTSVSAR